MAYSTKAVANLLLDLARDNGVTLSPMKLQKLVYFAHGWHLALNGSALIDEPVEAWRYGPVVSSLYHEFKRFGNAEITRLATEPDANGDDLRLIAPILSNEDRQKVEPLLRRILDVYGKFSSVQLSNMTHEPDTPWAKAWAKTGGVLRNVDIDNDLIKAYFNNKLTKPAG